MTSFKEWRTQAYGKITGGQLEDTLATFSLHWSERSTYGSSDDPEVALAQIIKLASIPNWVNLYQHSLLEMLAMMFAVAGIGDAIQHAAESPDPYTAVAQIIDAIPDRAPDHPAALPLAMVFTANLEAVARYSRSVNDMLAAFREKADFDALGQALSIDSALITLPFCQAMLRYGQLAGDSSAAEELIGFVAGPHKKRLLYPKLRWAEYLLRDRGAFDARAC